MKMLADPGAPLPVNRKISVLSPLLQGTHRRTVSTDSKTIKVFFRFHTSSHLIFSFHLNDAIST